MKKILIVVTALCFFNYAAEQAIAADEKKTGTSKGLIEAAFSPIDTILGPVTELDKIVVTPSRTAERIGSSSSSISVIDSADFERKKVDTIKEALKEEVGIDVVQAGPFQGYTDLLIRGGSSNQTLILIDGVKAYDPIAPGGGYNLANLTTDNVQQVEILRGPQSALYGSDAMAGVVSISSRKATKPYVNAMFEGGSFNTFTESVEAGSASHGFAYSISATQMNTKGLSQAQAKKNNQESDPYDRTSLATRADYDISPETAIGATFRYIKAHFAFDQGADTDDDNSFCATNEFFTTLYGSHTLFDCWEHAVKLGWMETKRQYFDDDSPLAFDFDRSKYFGRYFKVDYTSTLNIKDIDKVVLGYDHSEESGDYYSQNDFWGFMSVDDMGKVFARESSFFAENRVNIADRLSSTQGFRVSHHSRAGTNITYRFDGSYMFATGTKVRGLIASGYKAPSLYQLFAPANAFFGGGNPSLQPEKSQSYEYGIDQYICGDKLILGTTYFFTIYRDLIDAPYDSTTWFTGQYVNIGKSTVRGIEATIKAKPAKSLKVTGGFTYQKAWDYTNDQEMIRRPEHKFYVECFWQAIEKLSVDVILRYTGPRSDNLNIYNNTYKDKEYTVVNAVVNYDITKNFSAYVKFDNIFNKYYEDVRGYTSSPFATYGGVKARF